MEDELDGKPGTPIRVELEVVGAPKPKWFRVVEEEDFASGGRSNDMCLTFP